MVLVDSRYCFGHCYEPHEIIVQLKICSLGIIF